jgi:hypothetical protein
MLYHFTDTTRLPWILQSGELRAQRNAIGSYPIPEFVWATTSAQGDGAASIKYTAWQRNAWQNGDTLLVRFALHEEDFTPWPTVAAAAPYPAWTAEQITRLERHVRFHCKSNPATWWARAEPLPAARWVNVEARAWASAAWTPLQGVSPEAGRGTDVLAVVIGGRAYASRRVVGYTGHIGYAIWGG